jgi:hypothetical protein
MSLSISLHISISGHLQHLAQSAIKPDHDMNQRHRHGVNLIKELPTELDQYDVIFDWLPVQKECQHLVKKKEFHGWRKVLRRRTATTTRQEIDLIQWGKARL